MTFRELYNKLWSFSRSVTSIDATDTNIKGIDITLEKITFHVKETPLRTEECAEWYERGRQDGINDCDETILKHFLDKSCEWLTENAPLYSDNAKMVRDFRSTIKDVINGITKEEYKIKD